MCPFDDHTQQGEARAGSRPRDKEPGRRSRGARIWVCRPAEYRGGPLIRARRIGREARTAGGAAVRDGRGRDNALRPSGGSQSRTGRSTSAPERVPEQTACGSCKGRGCAERQHINKASRIADQPRRSAFGSERTRGAEALA